MTSWMLQHGFPISWIIISPLKQGITTTTLPLKLGPNCPNLPESLHLPTIDFQGVKLAVVVSGRVFLKSTSTCIAPGGFTPRVPAALAGKIPLTSDSQSLIHLREMVSFKQRQPATGIPRKEKCYEKEITQIHYQKRFTDSLTKNLKFWCLLSLKRKKPLPRVSWPCFF